MFRESLFAFALFGVISAAAGCAQAPPAPDIAADEAKLKSDALIWFEHYAKADADGIWNSDRPPAPPAPAAVKK